MANEKPVNFVYEGFVEVGDGSEYTGFCAVGKSPVLGIMKGALRFVGIDINQNQSINMARLIYKYDGEGSGSGSWKHKLYGIDEDNTGGFGSNPFGRTKTSALVTVDEGPPGGGGTKEYDVTSIVTEITQRGGWSNGNAMGFLFEDNGSSNDVYAFADLANSYLVYRIDAEPNFLPTPVTVSAPTFPAVDDYGLKISKAGVDVFTASRANLLFTTREDVTKIFAEAQVATTAGVEKLITHNLGYKPQCLVYARKNSLSFELPRLFISASDPVGSGVQGYFSVDNTYLRINTRIDADVYYFILLDEQAT